MQLDETIRGVLLDIEGTTSSIAFVHDVMFPFVLEHLQEFLSKNFSRADVVAACEQIAIDAGFASLARWQISTNKPEMDLIAAEVRRLMADDVKATGLKSLQGLVWQQGFDSGQLEGHVFPDVIPTLRRWRDQGLDLRIYSSGSIAAQKLYFSHTAGEGDCLHLFSGHYDTTIGGKRLSESYRRIAEDWKLAPANILFISDVAEELRAAREAGLQIAASCRPGNQILPDEFSSVTINSFATIQWLAKPNTV